MKTVKLKGDEAVKRPYMGELVDSLKALGLDLPKLGAYIAHGAEGEVYAYGPGKVIKVGIAPSMGAIRHLVNLLIRVQASQKAGCLAKVYEFDVLYKVDGSAVHDVLFVYYTIMERVEKKAREIVPVALLSDVNYVLSRCSRPSTFQKALEKADKISRVDKSLGDKLRQFCVCLQKTKFKANDMHLDNVMLGADGKLKVIDYGFTIAEPALQLIKAAQELLRLAERLVQARLYHGTSESFEQFDLNRAGARDYGDFGFGVYLTPKSNMAVMYARDSAKKTHKTPVVLVVDVQMKKTADLDDSKLWDDITAATGVPKQKALTPGAPQTRSKADSLAITKYLVSRGYDSVKARRGNEVVVYDPKLVKITETLSLEDVQYSY